MQNRLLFLRNLKSAVDHLRLKHPENANIQKLRCPKFVDVVMPTKEEEEDHEKTFERIIKKLKEVKLEYPFVIKLLQASRTTHAHSFYVVRSDEGLRKALTFEGFTGEHLLMQEWLKHHEQLYKLYCVGDKHFDFCIKTSIP